MKISFFLILLVTVKMATSQLAPNDLKPLKTKAPKPDEPVIVVGGGLAGLSAVLEALKYDASVLLIDKSKDIGGNSAKASSGINGANTETQRKLHIEDSTEKFYADTLSAGDRENDPGLADLLVQESAAAVEFLIDAGVDLTDINLCGGHSVPRTHWIPSPKEGKPLPVGFAIIKALKTKMTEFANLHPDKLQIMTDTNVVGVVTWNDFVTGVRVKNSTGFVEELKGKAVILATGGFSADRSEDGSLLKEFASDKLKLPTTNGAFATGDGVKMARAMGAGLVGMKDVQVHPTAFIDPKNPKDSTKFLAAEALRGKGAILVNEKGERFGNELGRRDYLTSKIYKHCAVHDEVGSHHVAYMLMNDKAADDFGRPAFNFYAKIKGFFQRFDNAAAVAEYINASVDILKMTLNAYNEYFMKSSDGNKVKDNFEKAVFPVAINPDEPIYVAQITPAIHYTMGGLKIDRQAYVFSEFMEKPFKGLLAAGEVTGGIHGRNRLAGNSLLECVVFGRIAGRNARGQNKTALHELKKKESLSKELENVKSETKHASYRIHALDVEVETAQSKLRQKDRTIEELREKNALLKKEVTRLSARVEDLTASLAATREVIEEKDSEIERKTEQLRSKKTEVKTLERIDDSSKERIEDLVCQVSELQQQLLDTQKEYLRKVKKDELTREKQRARDRAEIAKELETMHKPRRCKNCSETFTNKSNTSLSCSFHPGRFVARKYPLEGYQWSCCQKRELSSRPCKFAGRHIESKLLD